MALIKHYSMPDKYFTIVPNEVAQGLGDVSDSAYRVYMFLYSQGQSYKPSYGAVGKAIYCQGHPKGESNIRRAVNELKRAGLLDIQRTGYNRYNWHLYSPLHRNKEGEG